MRDRTHGFKLVHATLALVGLTLLSCGDQTYPACEVALTGVDYNVCVAVDTQGNYCAQDLNGVPHLGGEYDDDATIACTDAGYGFECDAVEIINGQASYFSAFVADEAQCAEIDGLDVAN